MWKLGNAWLDKIRDWLRTTRASEDIVAHGILFMEAERQAIHPHPSPTSYNGLIAYGKALSIQSPLRATHWTDTAVEDNELRAISHVRIGIYNRGELFVKKTELKGSLVQQVGKIQGIKVKSSLLH